MNEKFVINIGRQLGSGGKAVGERLAERFGIPVYDKRLIKMAAEHSGFGQEFFEKADEKPAKGFFATLLGYLRSPFAGDDAIYNNPLSHDALFKMQSDVIRQLAERESCIFVGRCADYILREQDLTRPIRHEDETCTTTWRIDQHYPMEKNSQQYPGAEWLSEGVLTPIDFYALPYRCFYSKDVDNLFMAGRNISVSHVALGTVRVMRTTAMMGEVVGMAASICSKHGALPHDVYDTRFEELRELMQRGAGRTDVPYLQVYTLIDTSAARSEEC